MLARVTGTRAARVAAGALAAVGLLTAGACSAAGGGPATPSTHATSPTTATTPARTTPAPTGSRTLDEHAARTTVRVRAGSTVHVRLHSTYWSTPTSSDPAVLTPRGAGVTPAGTCVPGGGCGLSTADFTAAHPGTAHLTAHRTSCGEAMGCAPAQRDYTVTVTVTG